MPIGIFMVQVRVRVGVEIEVRIGPMASLMRRCVCVWCRYLAHEGTEAFSRSYQSGLLGSKSSCLTLGLRLDWNFVKVRVGARVSSRVRVSVRVRVRVSGRVSWKGGCAPC